MPLSIAVEALPGDNIKDTAREMVELAQKIGHVWITCKFNGVYLSAATFTKPADIVREYHRRLKDGTP